MQYMVIRQGIHIQCGNEFMALLVKEFCSSVELERVHCSEELLFFHIIPFSNAANNRCKWSAAEFVSELICLVREIGQSQAHLH